MGKYIEVQISKLTEEHKKELVGAFLKTQAASAGEQKVVQATREVQTIQKTLGGYSVSVIPKVRTTDGHLMDWDRNAIINQLLKKQSSASSSTGSRQSRKKRLAR